MSFEIKRGNVVGIIGRNGAGKSTLLKILSRITEPTTGFAEIKGRVGALLEVGTGMHPELTGRENIYQNGCILGMRKWEIDKKFDEIVNFSGIEKFIDTPVKRYSSGQRVRLGFAIAAHLEPELLVVDEVLAVGDTEFQNKCIGKMKDVAGHGRTVLFVSHNMGAIKQLCSECILLNKGSVEQIGPSYEIIEKYIFEPKKNTWIYDKKDTELTSPHIKSITSTDIKGESKAEYRYQEDICFEITLGSTDGIKKGNIGISIENNSTEERVFGTQAQFSGFSFSDKAGEIVLKLTLKNLKLTPNTYNLSIALYSDADQVDFLRSVIQFKVIAHLLEESAFLSKNDVGTYYFDHEWEELKP
ncbi:MAG: ABC transporter ATP-binding protein [Opitutales bacterium]|nr:ABC transporter ATP-binding protein [Opitutales bacterium]